MKSSFFVSFILTACSVLMVAVAFFPLYQTLPTSTVYAAQDPGGGIHDPGGGIQDPGGGVQDPGGGTQDPGGGLLPNPVKNEYNTICKLINAILNIIAEIGAIVAALFIIWSGFLFILAQGNESKISEAKRTFYTTIIGTAILLGATVIAKIIFATVSSISKNGLGGGTIC